MTLPNVQDEERDVEVATCPLTSEGSEIRHSREQNRPIKIKPNPSTEKKNSEAKVTPCSCSAYATFFLFRIIFDFSSIPGLFCSWHFYTYDYLFIFFGPFLFFSHSRASSAYFSGLFLRCADSRLARDKLFVG